MPRHLISGAHEWINEIPTAPIYYLAKPQPREGDIEVPKEVGWKTANLVNQASFCHNQMRSSPFYQQTEAHNYLIQYCDLLDIDFLNHSFAQKNLANATFWTRLAFQMSEEMKIKKKIWILDLNLGRFLRYAICYSCYAILWLARHVIFLP